MKYKYIPSFKEIDLLIDNNIFLDLQLKYRESFENLLMQYINFEGIDDYIMSFGILIPFVDDFDYNFYHKFSYLGSKYLFLRNNFHVEKLNHDDQQIIMDAIDKMEFLSSDFLVRTYQAVLFEEGDNVFLGIPRDETMVDSKSLFFEFAYDEKKCQSIQQLYDVKEIARKTLELLNDALNDKINIPISTYIYSAIVDEFLEINSDN